MKLLGKKQGELAELKLHTLAFEKGWIVSTPFGDNSKYDLVVDVNGVLSRVQVKSTSKKDISNRQNRYTLIIGYGNKQKKPYLKKDVDIIAIYIIPEDVWYIIPIEELKGKVNLHFRPFDKSSKGKYEGFKMAWNIFSK